MTHRNEEVCTKTGGSFQVAAELNLSFSFGAPEPSVKRGGGSFCTYPVHLEKFGLYSAHGEPASAVDIEADNLNLSPAVPETPPVAVGKLLLLSRICKQGAGCWES